ncbi:MAG: tRNA pseudouridine(38-40) synthase TruA [Acutalibacteraceae bacterium]|nr:tRNA pseudouridine(38-40) synthase TruA [Acutalibacteraceae bacterium]
MRRYLLKIAFDGTDYHGWQVQPNGITVQEKMQSCINSLYGYSPDVTGCSRTDSGVHANEFYCHFDLRNTIDTDGIVKGLNSVLPLDIRALSCDFVESDFHCRYMAKGKNYIYRIDRRKITDPFNARYSYNFSGKLNLEDMKYFCGTVIGKHDFCGFSSSKRSVKDTVRTVSECNITENGDFLIFSISADGFLYNMVRIIVGTCISVGTGTLDKNIAEKIFRSMDRSLGGATAPAHALFLNKVYY